MKLIVLLTVPGVVPGSGVQCRPRESGGPLGRLRLVRFPETRLPPGRLLLVSLPETGLPLGRLRLVETGLPLG